MGCCGGTDTSEAALAARRKSSGKNGEGAELEEALGIESEGLMSGKGNNEVLKIGGSEYHKTDPEKNFVSSYCEIKTDNLNKGIAIMNYNNDAKSINLKEIKDFCQMYLNNEKIPFNFEYNFPKEGKYNFRFTYKFALLNTSHMFFGCKTIISLDLSNFDTSDCKNMGSMFFGCTNLETLNISNFNTSKVTYMSNMFGYCSSLKKLDLSSFNTENVTNMGNMFQDCSSLIELNIQNFSSKKITYMEGIFRGVNKKCNVICNDQKILNVFKS